MKIDFDSIVMTAAAAINEKDVEFAANEVECQINGRAWNMNRPLNRLHTKTSNKFGLRLLCLEGPFNYVEGVIYDFAIQPRITDR